MTETDRTVYAFEKNAREEVRATLSTYKGHRLGALRVFFLKDHAEWAPTQKGITVRVEVLPELRNAIDALIHESELELEEAA